MAIGRRFTPLIAQSLVRLARARAGIAFIEFAFALPLLILLMYSAVEITRFVLMNQKLDKLAYVIGDTVTIQRSVSTTDLNVLTSSVALKSLMGSYDTSSLQIVITSAHALSGPANPIAAWQHGPSGISRVAAGGTGTPVSITNPSFVFASDKDAAVVVEVFYSYDTLLNLSSLFGAQTDLRGNYYRRAVMRPRFGEHLRLDTTSTATPLPLNTSVIPALPLCYGTGCAGVCPTSVPGGHVCSCTSSSSSSSSSSGGSCFTGDTRVTMADGSRKRIDALVVGDRVRGQSRINRVVGMETPALGARALYSINGSDAFVTHEHPFMTTEGWKSIDPAATARENAAMAVGVLQVGDVLVREQGYTRIRSLAPATGDAGITVFNPLLDGDHTYYADGYLVHNKDSGGDSSGGDSSGGDSSGGDSSGGDSSGGDSSGGDSSGGDSGGSSCFVAGTRVTLADGSTKPIEALVAGDEVQGVAGINRVVAMETPLLGARKLYRLNKGPAFVTHEHPFLTTEGWKSIDPAATAEENPRLKVSMLRVGDVLVTTKGHVTLRHIDAAKGDVNQTVYNPTLTGDHTYYANGYAVHNKDGGDGGGDGGGGGL